MHALQDALNVKVKLTTAHPAPPTFSKTVKLVLKLAHPELL